MRCSRLAKLESATNKLKHSANGAGGYQTCQLAKQMSIVLVLRISEANFRACGTVSREIKVQAHICAAGTLDS